MKSRGAFLIGVFAVLIGGALWFWKSRDRDKPAAPKVTQQKAPAGAKPIVTPPKQGRLVVTVTDEKGKVGDAVVRLQPEDGDVIAVRTNAHGEAIADKLAAGMYDVSASAAGHEPAAHAEEIEIKGGDDVNVTIQLPLGGRLLSGVVTDVSGGPIAGARIDAAKLGGAIRPERAVATALTGPDGKYQLAVAEGQLLVAARSADYAAQSRLVDVGASGATADFALVPGGVIEGVVIDEKTRAPVAGAVVRAKRDSAAILLAETGAAIATADGEGKFRVAGLRPGAYELAAVGDGKRSKAPTIVGIGVAEQVGDVEILVGPSPVVRGTVVDESGAPVQKARVIAMGPDRGEGGKADDKGAFVLDGLPPGKYRLMANSKEHLGDFMNATTVEVKDKDVDGVVVRVRRGGTIVGRVEPPQSCEVKVESDERPGARRGGGPRGGMRIMRMIAPVTTAADGKFELGPLDDGMQTLSARCASGDEGEIGVEVKPGSQQVTLAVKPGGSIAGRVVDTEGKPVGGVSVMAAQQDDGGESTTIVNGVITSGVKALTNGNGEYVVRGLGAGTYRMTALDRGRPMPLEGKAPKVTLAGVDKKRGIDFAVERPNGVIKGVVIGPDGKPLADAWVSVHQDFEAMLEEMANNRDGDAPRTMMMRVEARDDDDGGGVGGASSFTPALTDAQGRFEIRNLPRAKYEVVAEGQAGKLRGRLARVEPDAEVTVKALGVTSLSGTVKSATGPTPLFTIELDGPTTAQRTFTDGKFELGRVDPGTYTVRVSSSDGNAEAKVEVRPGAPTNVDIALVANAMVVGTLVDGAGKPVAGLPVAVVPDEGEGRLRIALTGPPVTSGPDGKFRVEHKAGKGVLVVMTPPSPVTKRGLALEAGKTLDVGEIRVESAQPPP